MQRPPLGFQPQEKKNNLEDIITQLATNTNQFMSKMETTLQNGIASIRNLEVQMGQLATALSGRNHGV